MKNKFLISLTALSMAAFVYSCKDFIEVNLGKKSISVLAPADNTVSPNLSQQFKWEEVKGADHYQLQIVKPSFASIQQFLLDTNVTATQFTFTLQPGSYQWRVRAKNSSSATDYVVFNLKVDSTLYLTGQSVGLITPEDNLYSNIFAHTFTWQTLQNADSYIMQVLSGGTPIANPVPTGSTGTTANYTFTAEGVYQWRVFGQNTFGNSAFATRTITIDTTAPAVPVVVFPLSDTLTANPVPLKWNTSGGTDSTHLLVSIDSTFTSVSDIDITTANTINPNIYNFASAIVGKNYYWKVQAVDKAGNKKGYTYRRRFKRN